MKNLIYKPFFCRIFFWYRFFCFRNILDFLFTHFWWKFKDINTFFYNIDSFILGTFFWFCIIIFRTFNKKQLFLRYSSEKIIYEDEESAKKTVHSIFNNLDETNKESQYLEILEKYSNGEVLTPPEKEILKNFKKW